MPPAIKLLMKLYRVLKCQYGQGTYLETGDIITYLQWWRYLYDFKMVDNI